MADQVSVALATAGEKALAGPPAEVLGLEGVSEGAGGRLAGLPRRGGLTAASFYEKG